MIGRFRRAPSPLDLDLLPPGRHRSAAIQKAVLAVLGLVALALMVYLVLVARDAQRLRTHLAGLDQRLEAAYLEQEATLQAKRDELAELQARAQDPGGGQPAQPGPDNRLAALMAALAPVEGGLQLVSISVAEGEVSVIGVSQERPALDAYLARLESSALFAALAAPSIDELPGSYQFSLRGTLAEGAQ